MITIHWTNALSKAKNMDLLANRVGTIHANRWGTATAETGEESVNYSILSGGAHKTAKGGPRILNEAMINSVFSDSRNTDGLVRARAGYKRPPRYTIFQEAGTRAKRMAATDSDLDASKPSGSGIPAMLSIPQAIRDMEMAAEKAGTTMLNNIAWEWNSRV